MGSWCGLFPLTGKVHPYPGSLGSQWGSSLTGLQLTHCDVWRVPSSLWSSVSPSVHGRAKELELEQRGQKPSCAQKPWTACRKDSFQGPACGSSYLVSPRGSFGDRYFTKFPARFDSHPETYSGLFQRSKMSMLFDLFSPRDKYSLSTC